MLSLAFVRSISVSVCSINFGSSWTGKGQILTVGTKPTSPAWSGIGDFDVVWDWQQERWFMVTSHLRGAVSYHKGATAQSWRKWDGEEFSRENLIEAGEAFKDITGKKLPNGEHPSIMWNR